MLLNPYSETSGIINYIASKIGGPEALAVLQEMATGHPDALPTKTAKEAVESLTRTPP